MVANNAIQIRETLEAALTQETSAIETLLLVGPALLRMLTGDRAVALNQAAAADPSGNLGKALAQTGRDSVAPLICQTLERARHTGALSFDDPQTATDLYLGLLIGDLQLRRVTGQTHAPDTQQINQRAKRAVEILLQVFAP